MIAIYARVSTEEQALHGASLISQVEACRQHLGSPADTIQEFVDGGESGATLDRPQLAKLRQAIAQGQVSRLVIYDPDRLSRKLVHQLLLTEEFERAGVSLEFVNFEWEQSPEGRLFYSLRGAISEFEREKIRERTRRGWMTKARHGQLVAGMQRYGYLYDPQTKTVREDPETAPVVREIFRLAAEEHLSTGRIAQELARRRIKPPRGTVWWRDTVSKILRNPAYTGLAYVHQYDSVVRYRPRDPDEWIAIEVPAIVDPEVWSQARAVIYRYQKTWKGRQELPMLLRRVVYCGQCGHMMSTNVRTLGGVTYRYYFCPNRHIRKYHTDASPHPAPCTMPWIPASPVEDAVWTDVVALLDDPDAWKAAQETVEPVGESDATRIAEDLQRVRRSRNRLLELVRKELITLEDAERDLGVLKKEETRLKDEEDHLRQVQPSLPAIARNVREAMGPDLSVLSWEARREIILRLIEKVTLSVDATGTIQAAIQFIGGAPNR